MAHILLHVPVLLASLLMHVCILQCQWHALLCMIGHSMCVQLIKDTMDKKFGPAWQVVVGKGFSYDVQHEVRLHLRSPVRAQRDVATCCICQCAQSSTQACIYQPYSTVKS